MNKKTILKIFCSMICFFILFTACTNKNVDKEVIDEDIFNRDHSSTEQQEQVDYEFIFGPKNIEDPVEIGKNKLEYNMDIDNRGNAAEFGIMIVIDGIPQKTELENISAIMHRISLNAKEIKDYKFIMDTEALNINDGADHIIYSMMILEPDYIPENRNHFAHEGKLSATSGLPFTYTNYMKQDMKIGYVEPVKMDDQLRSEYNINKKSELENQILWSLDDPNNPFITLEDLKRGFDINLVGDVLGEMRVFLFANNQPVEINGYSFYDVKIQKGMVSKIHVDFTEKFISGLRNGDPVFLLVMPKNLDSVDAWPWKTPTKIIKGINHE